MPKRRLSPLFVLALVITRAAPSLAQTPEPEPTPGLLEFLGDWQPGEEVIIDEETVTGPVPDGLGDTK